MSEQIVERVAARFAQLSGDQKEDAVKQVMTNLEAKKKTKTNDKKTKTNGKKKTKPKKEEVEEVKVDEEKIVEEEKVHAEESESSMSDDDGGDDLMQSIEGLSQELERVKQDGRIDSGEVVGLFNNMMEMVNALLRAKPGRKVKAADRVACAYLLKAVRGLQVHRKDKDLMSDTGGTSKSREREPEQKPPREDMKKPHRTKDKPAEHRDKDTDNDKDLKAAVHPLDRKAEFAFGIEGPEDNYYRQVWGSLVGIIAGSEGISEKSFAAYDKVMQDVDELLRRPEAMEAVDRFESQELRPEFCAECLFSRCERV